MRLEAKDAPAALVRKASEYEATARKLNWRTAVYYETPVTGQLSVHVVARRSHTAHVGETVVFCWTFSSLAKFQRPIRFSGAWRVLVTHDGTGDWRDNAVGSEIKFHTIGEALEHLKHYAPKVAPKESVSTDDQEAILSPPATTPTKSTQTRSKKKMATKSAPAKKTAPAKKVAAAKKAPAKRAAANDDVIVDTSKAEQHAAEVEARKVEREQTKQAQRDQVVDLRDKQEKSWAEISGIMDLDMNICNIRYLEATEYATPSNPTPKALLDARAKDALSWVQIMAKFRFPTKAAAQKAYTDAGGDLKLQVGRGGRFIEQAAKSAGATKKAPAAKKAAAAKGIDVNTASVFNGDETPAAIKTKIIGKKITVKPLTATGAVREFKVPDSVVVGKDKSDTRVIQFNDGSGKTTLALAAIVKIGR